MLGVVGLFLSLGYVVAATNMRMEILGHSPCGATTGTRNPKIQFPSSKSAKVYANKWKPGCYTIKDDKVQVFEPGLSGLVEMRTTMQFGANSPLEPCRNADRNGCGGVGSCRYCDVCEGINSANQRNLLSILQRGNKIDCEEGLRPGNYSNVNIEICMPSKDQMLEMLHPNKREAQELWNIFQQKNGVPLILFSRLYKVYGAPNVKRGRPSKKNMVGCHWLYGKVYEAGKRSEDVKGKDDIKPKQKN